MLLLLLACAPLDEEACLAVAPDAECPSDEEASDQLVGKETCDDPVQLVTRTGAFLERVDDCTKDESGETSCCCYEAHLSWHSDELICVSYGDTP